MQVCAPELAFLRVEAVEGALPTEGVVGQATLRLQDVGPGLRYVALGGRDGRPLPATVLVHLTLLPLKVGVSPAGA